MSSSCWRCLPSWAGRGTSVSGPVRHCAALCSWGCPSVAPWSGPLPPTPWCPSVTGLAHPAAPPGMLRNEIFLHTTGGLQIMSCDVKKQNWELIRGTSQSAAWEEGWHPGTRGSAGWYPLHQASSFPMLDALQRLRSIHLNLTTAYSRAKPWPPLTHCSSVSYNPGHGLGWSKGVTVARTTHLPSFTPS